VVNGQVLYPSLRRNFSRTFVQPANPSTSFQDDIRALFTALTQEYSSVTDAENIGWVELARFITRKDKDGNSVVIGAKAAFIQINFWEVIGGGTITHTAPTYGTVAGILVLSAFKRNAGDTGWQLTYTWDGANTSIVLKATAPLPGLRLQPRSTDYRFATTDPADSIKAITSAGGTLTVLDADSRFALDTADRIGITAQVINADAIPLQTFQFQGVMAAP
jgi:hypothetical protein